MILETANTKQGSAGRVRGNHEQGSVLIEVIVAISILTIGLLALASMQVASIKGNAFAGNVTRGTCLGADRLEKLMALPYTHSDLSAGNHTDPSPPRGYAVTWDVTDDSPVNGTKTVEMRVTWIDHGVQKGVSLRRVVPRII
jgi:type IV pilus assembly protein PilV